MAKQTNQKFYYGIMTSEKENNFIEVFRENKDIIFRLCYVSLNNKDDVDDLFQEVMINVWRNLDNFRRESKIKTWLYRITVNTALLYNKKFSTKSKRFKNIDPMMLGEEHYYEEPFTQNLDQDLKNMHRAVSMLQKQDRIIIGLFLEGVSYKEISDIVGISINYVGVRINRIKAALAKTMEGLK